MSYVAMGGRMEAARIKANRARAQSGGASVEEFADYRRDQSSMMSICGVRARS